MDHSRHITFPDTPLGSERQAEVGFSVHGDVRLKFWDGVPGENGMPETAKVFPLVHGSEVTLMACLIGYYRRLGVDGEQIRGVFRTAAEPILADAETSPEYYEAKTTMHSYSFWDAVASGERMPLFDQPARGWESLAAPIPTEPGAPERVRGTGVYTRVDVLGNHVLLLAFPPDLVDETPASGERPRTMVAELAPPDVPPLARAICDIAMGEYRREIYQLVKRL